MRYVTAFWSTISLNLSTEEVWPVSFDKITVEVQKKGLDINDKLKKKILDVVDKLVQVPTHMF